MTTAQKPDALHVVAWRYKTAHTTHLCHSRLDHYFSNDEGQTYIKGEPLVRLSGAKAALQALAAEKDAEIAAAYERDHEKAMSEAKRWAEFIPEIRGNYSAESVIALLGNLVTDLRARGAEDETLLRRCLAQLGRWQGKYGEHNPSWLPPAGDVKLAEDIDSAIALAAKEAK